MGAFLKHAEAFCLMHYACDCGHHEIIHNSRDGVTPFGLLCPSCGENSLRHVDWHRDERRPDYTPFPGQRYFRDGTPEEALAFIEQRIERFTKAGHAVPDEVVESLRADARNTAGEWQKGWPIVCRTPDRSALPKAEVA
jgi:hypothetical protein